VWNFDMIISFTDGTVYRVTPSGTVTFVATTSTHQESPRVIPNDTTKWGAFAGCISTASETQHKVFAICNPGSPTVSTLATGILNAESSDIRPVAGETTFGANPYVYFGSRFLTGQIWGYPASSFPVGSAGDMFVSREFAGGITRVAGPGNVTTFEGAFGQHYEGSNFCFNPGVIETIGGRMTGGGSVFASNGTRVTHGFELHCDASKGPNNLQVNWGKGNRFHLESLTSASCSDDPNIAENPPAAGFDTYKGEGTGRYNGVSGATAKWTFTDAGEPGKNDLATTEIKVGSTTVLSVSGNLNSGNQQAHKD
jgi:hypothetical protein